MGGISSKSLQSPGTSQEARLGVAAPHLCRWHLAAFLGPAVPGQCGLTGDLFGPEHR